MFYCCELAVDWRQPELKAVMDTLKKIYSFSAQSTSYISSEIGVG